MPYFFILPAYIILLLGLLAVSLGLRRTRFRPAARYVLGAALGSVPGFIGANALLLPLLQGIGQASPTTANGQAVRGLLAATVLFLGPFAMSAFGVGVGAVLGLYVAWRRRQLR